MLAALLANLPEAEASGPSRGFISAGTSWNPEWSIKYGPDAERLKRDKETVKEAVETLRQAEHIPPEIEQAKEIVHSRSLVEELSNYRPDTEEIIVFILESWLFFIEWRKRQEKAIAVSLLMLD